MCKKVHICQKMDIYIPEKVLKYEEFINDVLKEQLRKTALNLDQTYSEISEFVQLENMIQTIQENNLVDEGLKTKVDIGCNFYMQAFVPDPSKILIDIGLGCYLEFTLSEALVFIKRRVDVLNKKVDILRDQSANTKAHIKLVLSAIQEIQKLKLQPLVLYYTLLRPEADILPKEVVPFQSSFVFIAIKQLQPM